MNTSFNNVVILLLCLVARVAKAQPEDEQWEIIQEQKTRLIEQGYRFTGHIHTVDRKEIGKELANIAGKSNGNSKILLSEVVTRDGSHFIRPEQVRAAADPRPSLGDYKKKWRVASRQLLQKSSKKQDNDTNNIVTGPFDAELDLNGEDRIKVQNLGYPFDIIGMFDNGCSGALVGPYHVLTAGHCVLSPNGSTWFYDLGFTPSRNGEEQWSPKGRAEYIRSHVLTEWQDNTDFTADIAMVVLDKPIGQWYGFLDYGFGKDDDMVGLNMAGYPTDKPSGEMWYDYCDGTPVHYDQKVVYHKCTSRNGNSGSPLWVYRKSDGFRQIRAVHTGAVTDVSNVLLTQNSLGETEQKQPYGVIISKERSNVIKGWLAEDSR